MSSRIWLGGIFLFVGIGILLHQLEIWDFIQIVKVWWPLIFVISGITHLFQRDRSSPLFGILLIIIGCLFILNHWIDQNILTFIWPFILISIGLLIIFSRTKFRKVLDSNHSLKSFSLFSGADLRSQSTQFQGGEVMAIFGGAEIDLRDVIVDEAGAVIEIVSVFGGVNINVPDHIYVEITGLPIFGGWENKTRRLASSETDQRIKINCLTIFGGVEVSN